MASAMRSFGVGGALAGAYGGGGRASGFGFGKINPSPMMANEVAYGEYMGRQYQNILAREEAERERQLAEIERELERIESRRRNGRLSTTDEMRYQRLINQFNQVLNPGRGFVGFADTPQAVPSSTRIGDAGRQLKRLGELERQLGMSPESGLPPSGREKSIMQEARRLGGGFSRIAEAEAITNPQKVKDYELAKARYELDLSKETRIAQKEQARQKILKDVNDAIKSGELDAETIAELNALNNRRFEAGADVDGIVAEMGARAEAARTKEARAVERDVERERRSAEEFDRRRGVINNERLAAENRQAQRNRVRDESLSASQIQDHINEITDDIASLEAQIAELESIAQGLGSAPENASRVNEVSNAIQVRRVQISGLEAEAERKQSRAQSPAGGGREVRRMVQGRVAIFDGDTRQFIRWE